MNLTTLKTKVQTAITAVASTTVKTLKIGYLSEIGTGQDDFYTLLIIPPKAVMNEVVVWNKKDFQIKIFLIALDKSASTGEFMTEAERTTCWDALEAILKLIIGKFIADPTNMQVIAPLSFDYNSGGQDGIITERVIWIECNMTLRVNDC